MKSLLILIRVMVAISMPAAGFFFAVGAEGAYVVSRVPFRILVDRIVEQVEREPTEAQIAQINGAREVAGEISAKVTSFYNEAGWAAFFITSILCALSMWAGRKVKRLMQLPAIPEQRT